MHLYKIEKTQLHRVIYRGMIREKLHNFTDVTELYTLILDNSTLNNRIDLEDDAESTIVTTRVALNEILLGKLTVD